MFENKARLAILVVLLLALILVVTLSIRGANRPAPTPTVSMGEIQTAAVATFGSALTRTAEAIPTSTSTSTPVSTETPAGTETLSPTPSCYRLRYIKDVTIPDQTVMKPGEAFVKTWLIENNGTCAWRPGFLLRLIGGDAMSATTFTLTQTVEPGGQMELSLSMTAPLDQQGTVAGTWQMSDENGNFFGSVLTVVIDLGGATATPTP
ncbi:MAG: hypothetical protein HY258_11555 [Chloroflexi bacterium]|nr:hypothetical protein [Chloroflexota bacterium]